MLDKILNILESNVAELDKIDSSAIINLSSEDKDKIVSKFIKMYKNNVNNPNFWWNISSNHEISRLLYSNFEFLSLCIKDDPSVISNIDTKKLTEEEIEYLVKEFSDNATPLNIEKLDIDKNSILLTSFNFVKLVLKYNPSIINNLNIELFKEKEQKELLDIFNSYGAYKDKDKYFKSYVLRPNDTNFFKLIETFDIFYAAFKNRHSIINYIDTDTFNLYTEDEKNKILDYLLNSDRLNYFEILDASPLTNYIKNNFEAVKKLCLSNLNNLNTLDLKCFSAEEQKEIIDIIKENVKKNTTTNNYYDYNFEYLSDFYISRTSPNYDILIGIYEIVSNMFDNGFFNYSKLFDDINFEVFNKKEQNEILRKVYSLLINKKLYINFYNKNYKYLISFINSTYFSFENLNERMKEAISKKDDVLCSLFNFDYSLINLSDLTKVVTYLVTIEWEMHRSHLPELYINLSINLCDSLKENGFEETIKRYKNQIECITKTLNISEDKLFLIFKNYESGKITFEEIKSIVDKFNVLEKADYIKNNTDILINRAISNLFKMDDEKVKKMLNHQKQNKYFLNILNSDVNLQENINTFIMNVFNDKNLSFNTFDVVKLILDRKYGDALSAIYGNDYSKKFYDRYLKQKEYVRVCKYLDVINKNFDKQTLPSIIIFIKSFDDIKLKEKFSIEQIKYLNDLKDLLSNSNYELDIELDKIVCKNKINLLSDEERKIALDYELKLDILKKNVSSYLFKEKNRITKDCDLDKIHISDAEVKLELSDYILDEHNVIANELYLKCIIENIDVTKIKKIYEDKEEKKVFDDFMKKIIMYEAIIDNRNLNFIRICNLVESFDEIYHEFGNINIDNLDKIMDMSEILSVSNELDRTLLAIDVIRKIARGNTLFDINTSTSEKRKLIDSAIKCYYLSQYNNASTVPYISFDGDYKAENYLNNYDDIYISGIDTNACFRLGSTDNNFLVYTILNKNGFVVKFTNKSGQFIGRVSGFRNGNILYLNQLRSIYDNGNNANKDKVDEQNKLINSLKNYVHLLMEESYKTPEPIEHTVITESYAFNNNDGSNKYDYIPSILIPEFPMSIEYHDYDEYKKLDVLSHNYLKDGFQTDYMNGDYKVIILESKKGCKLDEISDIKVYDASAIYTRPRKNILTTYSDINDINKAINRIYALRCIAENSQDEFSNIFINPSDFECVYVGEDWYYLTDKKGNIYKYILHDDKHINEVAKEEATRYIEKQKQIKHS